MRYLLDTSALLAHHRQELGWEQVQALMETKDAEILVASVSLVELGRRLRDLGVSDTEVATTLSSYELLLSDIVAIDRDVARAAFDLGCRIPQRLPLVDALIAAAAQSRAATLVHRDAHLRPIPSDLVVQLELSEPSQG